MYFRPLIGLSLVTAILFSLLMGLGTWQLERLPRKLSLIASVHRNLEAPPMSLAEALGDKSAQYRRVMLQGRYENDREAYVFATGPDGKPVYHVLVPFLTAYGALLVDRGV